MKSRILRLVCALSLPLVLPRATRAQTVATISTPTTSLSASATVPLQVQGYGSVAFQLTGTWTGTASFKGSADQGCGTWVALNATATNSTSIVTSATANGIWIASAAGLRCVEVDFSWSSGTVLVNITASAGGGGAGGGGGGAGGSVTINDPTITTQKAAVNASGQLSITCANCSGSGASAVDESTFTQGTNSVAPAGGLFKTSYTALTSGQVGIAQMTSDGAIYSNVYKINGTTIATGNGTTSAGSPRVTIASDNTAFTVNAAQSGTWTVQPGNTSNTTPWLFQIRDGAGNVRNANVDASNRLQTLTDINGVTLSSGRIPVLADINNGSTTITEAATITAGQSSVALTSSVVYGFDGTTDSRVTAAGSRPASGAVGLTVRPLMPTNGTQDMPTMDAAARPGFVKVTDGTNTMPTLDTAARAGFMTPAVATTGGATPAYYISAASNNSTNIKASAGQIYYLTAINTTATLKYIRLYDSGSAPTCTSSTGVVFYSPIPANSTTGAGFVVPIPPGITFSNGLGFCITGAAGVTDNTSTAAGDVVINYGWK